MRSDRPQPAIGDTIGVAYAAAGEVLTSRTVVDLTAGSGLHFEPRGDYTLKGVPGTWPLFAAQTEAVIPK